MIDTITNAGFVEWEFVQLFISLHELKLVVTRQ